jgi:hypothetical protein
LIQFSPSSLGYQPEACFDRPMDNQLFPGPDANTTQEARSNLTRTTTDFGNCLPATARHSPKRMSSLRAPARILGKEN